MCKKSVCAHTLKDTLSHTHTHTHTHTHCVKLLFHDSGLDIEDWLVVVFFPLCNPVRKMQSFFFYVRQRNLTILRQFYLWFSSGGQKDHSLTFLNHLVSVKTGDFSRSVWLSMCNLVSYLDEAEVYEKYVFRSFASMCAKSYRNGVWLLSKKKEWKKDCIGPLCAFLK